MYNPKSEPSGNCGFGMIVMCRCKFICYKKCTTLMGRVDNGGGAMYVWQQTVYGKSLYLTLLLQFCLEPGTVLKKKSKKDIRGELVR